MEAITATNNTQQTQEVNPVQPEEKKEEGADDFSDYLRAILKPSQGNQVSEEALFAGVVQQRIKSMKGEDAAKSYGSSLDLKLSSTRLPDGYVSYEDSAKAVLLEMQNAGSLTTEEAQKIYSEAFSAAQLDDKEDALFDDRGGAGDPTMAMAELELAIKSAEEKLGGFESLKSTPALRDLNEASTGWSYKNGYGGLSSVPIAGLGGSQGGAGDALSGGSDFQLGASGVIQPKGTVFDGSGEFLFKPVSNNEQKLAVILPSKYLNDVSKILLRDEQGQEIDEGRFTSNGDFGTNAKYAFSKSGGEYPKNITVEVIRNDGTTVSWAIPDPSKRYD